MEPTTNDLLQPVLGDIDQWAIDNGWLIAIPNEAYMQQVFQDGHLVLHKIGSKWWVEYSTKTKGKMSENEKATVKAQNVSLDRAKEVAQSFVDWAAKQRKRYERMAAAAEQAKPKPKRKKVVK